MYAMVLEGAIMKDVPFEIFSSYSIIVKDLKIGMFEAAVQTHQMSVGTIAPRIDPVAGAVMTQAMVNIDFLPERA
jgi:uncharacterized Ntn-hydrolase superfamily protein